MPQVTTQTPSQNTVSTNTDENTPEKKSDGKKFIIGLLLFVLAIIWLFSIFKNGFGFDFFKPSSSINARPTPVAAYVCPDKRFTVDEALKQPALVCDIEVASDNDLHNLFASRTAFTHLEGIYFKAMNATISAEIADIPSLNTLNFHHTVNTSFTPEIGKLKQLQVIRLSKADIEHIPVEIGELENLTQLIIVLNVKPVTIPPTIEKLTKLHTLTLRNNPAVSLPKTIMNNRQLDFLDLTDNSMEELPTEILKLHNLTTLNLSLNELKTIPFGITDLSALRELRLDENQLTIMPSVEKLQQLEVLTLNNNRLTVLPLGVETLKKLKYLNIANNPIDPSTVEALKQALPTTQIVY